MPVSSGSGVITIFFYKDWPEIRKSEIPPSEVWPISEDWDELWIPNSAQIFLIKYYWMLQNARVTAFTVFELLKENKQEEEGINLPFPPRLRLIEKIWLNSVYCTILRDHWHFLQACTNFYLTILAPYVNQIDSKKITQRKTPYQNQIDYILLRNNTNTNIFDPKVSVLTTTKSVHKPATVKIMIKWNFQPKPKNTNKCFNI